MTTLDEAIKGYEDLAEDLYERGKIASKVDYKYANFCGERAENNKQFAEWLKDYKRLLNVLDEIKAEIVKVINIYEGSCDQDLGIKWGYEGALEIIDEVARKNT